MIEGQIKEIIEGEVILDNLDIYSRDASIFEVKPQVVVRPKDVEDVKALVNFVADNKSANPNLSLTVRAGGSDMTGGPLNESIILDFTAYMTKIISVEGDPPHAVVEPGVLYRDFERETLKKGLLLPSYPASREICTVGGMVANNAGGEKSLRYGKTDQYVEELNVVLSDGNEYVLKALNLEELEQKKNQNNFEGEMYRNIHELLEKNYEIIQKAKPDVSKNSAGYALWNVLMSDDGINLTKLFVGSQGTLGIITKIKLRLIRPNQYSKLFILFLKDLNKIGDLAIDLNKYGPESMESYDDNTIKLVFKILPDLVRKIGVSVLFKFIPDIWLILTDGMPKLVILAEFTGDNPKELTNKIEKVQKEISDKFNIKTKIASDTGDVQKYWTIRRESFNLLRKHLRGKKAAPFIDDIIVRPEHLPKFLPELTNILDGYKNYMLYTIAGHPGDGNFHIIPLVDLSDEKIRNMIPELSGKVYDLVIRYGGSITAEHNDGLIRTPYLEKMYGKKIYGLFEEVKKIFDPQNIFNPRKKVPSTGSGQAGNAMEYAMKHIRTNF